MTWFRSYGMLFASIRSIVQNGCIALLVLLARFDDWFRRMYRPYMPSPLLMHVVLGGHIKGT
jgi:hypothetical protein